MALNWNKVQRNNNGVTTSQSNNINGGKLNWEKVKRQSKKDEARTNAYNTLLNASNVSTYKEMKPETTSQKAVTTKFDLPAPINTSAGDTGSLNTPKYREIKNKNDNNVIKGSINSFGANLVDATVDTGQFVKNAFKSEMKKEEREAIEGLIKLENGYRGLVSKKTGKASITDEQAQNMINNIRKKYNLEGLTVEQLQNKLDGIIDWTYKENALEKTTSDAVKKVNEENAKLGEAGQFVTNAFGTVGRMGPTIASNIALPGSGTATMFASTAQSQTEDLMEHGVNYKDAVANGLLSGVMETGTEMISGGMSQKLTGIPALSKISKYTDDIANPVIKTGLNIGGDILGEGLEEVASTAIQPFIDRITYNSDASLASGEEMWSSFVESILPTLLMQGGSVAVQKVNEYKNAQKKVIENSNMPQTAKEQMIQALEEQKDKISAQIQAQLNQKTPQKNINLAQTSPNIEHISQNSVQNVSNLENTVQMEPIQKILSLQTNGGYRTAEQLNKLEENIRENGIQKPIELIKNKDGQVIINDGNHRLAIAQKLGLKEVPVKYLDSDIENIQDIAKYNEALYNEQQEGADANANNKIRIPTNEKIQGSRNNNGYGIRDNSSFERRGTTEENDAVFGRQQGYNNRSSSGTTRDQDIAGQEINNKENSTQGSFSLNKNQEKTTYKPSKNIIERNEEFPSKITTVKTRNHERKSKNNLLNSVIERLETTPFGNTKTLRNITESVVRDSREQKLTDEKIKQYANVLYDSAIRIDSQFYDVHKKLKDYIRKHKIYASEKIIKNIADWNEFRKSNFGVLNLTNDSSAIFVDSFYKELSDDFPYLFPGSIYNEVDQVIRISEVAKSIKKIEERAGKSLEEIYGPEFRNATIEEIKSDIKKLAQEIERVDKVERDNAEKANKNKRLIATAKSLSIKDIEEIQNQNAKLQREYDKALRKELLSNKDKAQLDRIIKGELELDDISGKFNKGAITRLYELRKPIEENKKKLEQYKKGKKAEKYEEAETLTENSDNWKEKKFLGGLRYSTETAERNIRDIIQDEAEAEEVINTYFRPVHENEAKSTKHKNNIISKIKDLDLSIKEKYDITDNIKTKIVERLPAGEVYTETKLSESALVQLYGEKIINEDDIKSVGADFSKINNAVNVFRDVYNELIKQANNVLIENGYAPVEYRKDYFPHFTETKPDTMLKKIASKFGIETANQELPSDIAGLTHTFKPGKRWVANFLERKGNKTDYDALKGMDKYLETAMDVIYHTTDIQKLRAFEDAIRYKFSDKGIQEKIDATRERVDIDDIEKNSILNDLYNTDTTKFSHLVTWIREYTDNLSGKKSIEDRNMEHQLGRSAYTTMKNVSGRVASNMIGGNINSALTNFIPLAQGWGEVSTGSMIKSMWHTARNAAKADGLIDASDFLTNRRGNDKLYKTTTDKIVDKSGVLMNAIDEFTSETLVRAKYYDNLASGMTEQEAMHNADEFASSVMADRSKGAKPTAFNVSNPVKKLFTMFQLEVNNQYRYAFKDLPRNVKDEVGNDIAKALFKIFLGTWIYGELKEKLTGDRSITDPTDMIAGVVKDIADENVTAGQTIVNAGTKIVQELPFISGVVGGGRIPISSAFPDIENTIKAGTGLVTGEMPSNKAISALAKEFAKPAAYLLLPTGGGQIKKIIEGTTTVNKGGEYGIDSQGRKILKFPVDTKNMSTTEKIGTYTRAGIFGKYSLPTAQDYVNSGFKTLNATKTAGYDKAIEKGITAKTYFDINQKISKVKPDGEKFVNGERKAKIIDIIESYEELTREQQEFLYKVFYKNEVEEGR